MAHLLADLFGEQVSGAPYEATPYYLFKSLTGQATWTEMLYDLGYALGSVVLGMLVYVAIHGSPFKIVELDVSELDTKVASYCYTEEEVKSKYGEDEGRLFGDSVQICGEKLPQSRALKFMKHSGPKVAAIFAKLSFEEKHALMAGSARLPEDVMLDSLRSYYRGSDGEQCDRCKEPPTEEKPLKVCGRCKYSVCAVCTDDKRRGQCFCKDENFGIPYPPRSRRKYYERGLW